MKNPVSIFLLDVSNSSTEEMGKELTLYLDKMVTWITTWTKEIGHIHVKHRSGDEIIFVGYGYSTAYILSFFLSRIWKYEHHKPYFGLSFGDIDQELEEIDIEKWIHPLMKQARYANDLLKQEQNRPLFKFELDQFYPSVKGSFVYHEFRHEFEILFNALLHLQQTFSTEQTIIQKTVCSAYLILQQQKAVGKLLSKTPPTISSHFKKGKCEEIIQTFFEIINVLNSLQNKAYERNVGHQQVRSDILLQSIRTHLNNHLNTLLQSWMNRE